MRLSCSCIYIYLEKEMREGQAWNMQQWLMGSALGALRTTSRTLFFFCLDILKPDEHAVIRWWNVEERESMHRAVCRFLKCGGLVDVTTQEYLLRTDAEARQERYDGYNHFHCFAVPLWADAFGVRVPLDILLHWSKHDPSIYNESAPFRHPWIYLSEEELIIGDIGFENIWKSYCFPVRS